MKNSTNNGQMVFMKGSEAVAEMVAACQPGVVAAYPITPQTGIIEHLIKLIPSGRADFSFLQSESEYSSLSMALGAAAVGVSAYTATSSQGLLHMAEVVYNLPGLRLPLVMTCANRSISSPINIWNDHQDAMAVREAGWLMFFAENNQEAIEQHWLAFMLSQKLRLPVIVNVDGFRLTHASEPIALPSTKLVRQLIKNKVKAVLDVEKPQTTGWFTMPKDYQEQRMDLKTVLENSWPVIEDVSKQLQEVWQPIKHQVMGSTSPVKVKADLDQAAIEYYGPQRPRLLIIAMGSLVGELKELADLANQAKPNSVAILKIKIYRPFPGKVIGRYLKKAKNIMVIDRSPGLGAQPPLFSDIKASQEQTIQPITSLIIGLGGNIDLKEVNKKIKLYV